MAYDSGAWFRGQYLLYFTDNIIMYYVIQQGSSSALFLHALVCRVKLLVAQLEILLEVVHVPGDLVIQHNTDALS
eukprot:7167567-Ditylum_brightwellii.AAC.3